LLPERLSMTLYMDVCRKAALAGGQVLLDMRDRVQPREKGPKDWVTEADFASQETVRQIVLEAFPEHGFLGEEEQGPPDAHDVRARAGADSEFCWVVDPLDGTLNYARQLPNYSVSVALRRGFQVVVGTVYDPLLDECFTAEAGQGAKLNGVPIRTSSCERLEQALIATSLPAVIPRHSPEVKRFLEVMHAAQAIRRLGSAALNLCYVACGRLDGYWATSVKIWDVGAGQLIVHEAGGALTRLDGTRFELDDPQFVAAATPQLHEEFLAVLRAGSPVDGR
jgi:myo-inositol-1(or 4)-monophosphatase